MTSAADQAFQEEIVESLRKALAGQRISETDEEKRSWEARFMAIWNLAAKEYPLEVVQTLVDRAAQLAEATVESVMGDVYEELRQADERRREE